VIETGQAESTEPNALSDLGAAPTLERMEERRARRLSRRGRCIKGSQRIVRERSPVVSRSNTDSGSTGEEEEGYQGDVKAEEKA
jgi:hypothetical protein